VILVETNSIWYLLGGVLAISLALEILTGILLSVVSRTYNLATSTTSSRLRWMRFSCVLGTGAIRRIWTAGIRIGIASAI
jgi:hypothetical protein